MKQINKSNSSEDCKHFEKNKGGSDGLGQMPSETDLGAVTAKP